jgi:hypothetical protein
MFWQAKASIPGKQPITDDILAIGEHNRSVDRVLDIVREDEARAKNEYQGAGGKAPSVARRIEDMLEEKGYGRMALAKPLALSAARGPIAELRAKIEEDAAGNVPIMEESYTRLRVQSVLEQFTRVLNTRLCKMPEGYAGRQSALARAVVMEWAKRKKLTGVDIDRTARKAFLDAFDLGYHRRKLRFVNDWLNKQYEPGGYGIPRDLIQQAQEVLVKRINALSALMIADDNFETFGLGNKVDLARAVVCKPAKGTANDQAKELLDNSGNLKALDDFALGVEAALPPRVEAILAALFDDFIQQTAKWNNPIAARAVLARYLGFPYWDRASYPYTAFSGLGDLTHVDIVRFSPDDTDAISKKGANKLVGIGLGHFKAFLDANGRQTDYLWGRLDGAQRVLGLLGIKADDDPRLTKTFDAIVSEEEADVHGVKPANLTKIKDCVSHKTQC